MPLRAEKLTLVTACEQCKKGSMKRVTWILDEAGRELAMVDSRWIVVDTTVERIVRQPGWTTPGFWNADVAEELPQLVHKSKDLLSAGTHLASYSLCDQNRHVNNALYLDIACDVLPPEAFEAGPLRFASVKYHREIPMGSAFEVQYAPSNGGWYVVGRRGEHMAFECYLEFGEAEPVEAKE